MGDFEVLTGTTSPHREAERLERLAHWLDDRYRVPGTGIRFGWDSVVGLIPGLGDGATTILALYIVLRARHLGVPRAVIMRMAANVAADLVLGAVPIVGDLADVGFKANRRNIRMLQKHLKPRESAGTSRR